jgi:hypothetical protein
MQLECFEEFLNVPWFWIEELSIREFSPNLCNKLELSYQNYLENKNDYSITFVSLGKIYSIDFNRMTQMNTHTNKVKKKMNRV